MRFSAVIFDLDGVITKTALVHGAAWKRMFDEYLMSRHEQFNETFREFTHANDYLPYVDGKPRYKGVNSFLESRNISIPYGDPSDPPEAETVCGLGNRKNFLFNAVLNDNGVEVYDSSVQLIRELKKNGIKVGVASSSKNCKPVLEKAGLLDLFETRVDGVVSVELGLKGKPEPDIFTVACDRVAVPYHRAVIVEDATSGVQAGKNGNFGLVLGVAREDNMEELKRNGADIVVTDLAEINMDRINNWFEQGMEEESWHLKYFDYDPENERTREALLTTGNGYIGTRGAMTESSANKINYPGTYVAGVYNRLTSIVAGKEIENEDFVNVINWLPVSFKIEDGEWFKPGIEPNQNILQIERQLDFRNGLFSREMTLKDPSGRKTLVRSERFVSMDNPHCAAIKYSVQPLNYSARVTIRSTLSGDHINGGVERYNQLGQKHLAPVRSFSHKEYCSLEVKTTSSRIHIYTAAKHQIQTANNVSIENTTDQGRATIEFSFQAGKGRNTTLEKLVVIGTSMDSGKSVFKKELDGLLTNMDKFSTTFKSSAKTWRTLWDKINVVIGGDREVQKLVRLHLYHMMVSASPHTANLDVGIPPRGLHGEAYRGHIFWDEVFMLPLYNAHFPEVAKSVLMYRYRRINMARKYARAHGYEGAMFPWQSGSDGREETQVVHLNPDSGEWGKDYSSLQRHISLAIAFNLWSYYQITGDSRFMNDYGSEILFEIARFWAGKCRYDKKINRYHIDQVMGPDEFHEKIPGTSVDGLTDNAYTNIMVHWLLSKALQISNVMTGKAMDQIRDKINLKEKELEHWNHIKDKLTLNISADGIIEQFKGYFKLKDLDWGRYLKKYGDIQRLDRILKSEGKSPDAYKVSKQADLLMSFYLLGEKEVTTIINALGYTLPKDYFERNFKYYISRTSHGSTLSRLVHGALAYHLGLKEKGWTLFLEAMESDLNDIQGGTTGEGVHCGVLAGTVNLILSVFGGLDLLEDPVRICPDLPEHWNKLHYNFDYRQSHFQADIIPGDTKIIGPEGKKDKIKLDICGR